MARGCTLFAVERGVHVCIGGLNDKAVIRCAGKPTLHHGRRVHVDEYTACRNGNPTGNSGPGYRIVRTVDPQLRPGAVDSRDIDITCCG